LNTTLKGWKLEVFKCVQQIPNQTFTLQEITKFESQLKKTYPENNFIKDKIRQQLQNLRDLGLIEFLGNGNYKKLWK
jgi:type II restriction enzyme